MLGVVPMTVAHAPGRATGWGVDSRVQLVELDPHRPDETKVGSIAELTPQLFLSVFVQLDSQHGDGAMEQQLLADAPQQCLTHR
jgi:hypothetical protein